MLTLLLIIRHSKETTYICSESSTVFWAGTWSLSGDDWEHEETFTDDDEALDIDPEERPDVADTENPTGPDIKQVERSARAYAHISS